MTFPILTRRYDAPPVDRDEIVRYAHGDVRDARLADSIAACLGQCLPTLRYEVCFARLPCHIADGTVSLGPLSINSTDLAACLSSSPEAIVFAATVGIGVDKLIARASVTSPHDALLYQAIGAERIEALCDRFCRDIASGKPHTFRYSPGYGDLPLEIQKDLFSLLDCPRRIGLTLNDSLLMSPSKSVTAIFGIGELT